VGHGSDRTGRAVELDEPLGCIRLFGGRVGAPGLSSWRSTTGGAASDSAARASPEAPGGEVRPAPPPPLGTRSRGRAVGREAHRVRGRWTTRPWRCRLAPARRCRSRAGRPGPRWPTRRGTRPRCRDAAQPASPRRGKTVEGARSVAADDHIGTDQQVVQDGQALSRVEVDERASLARGRRRPFRPACRDGRVVESHHLSTRGPGTACTPGRRSPW